MITASEVSKKLGAVHKAGAHLLRWRSPTGGGVLPENRDAGTRPEAGAVLLRAIKGMLATAVVVLAGLSMLLVGRAAAEDIEVTVTPSGLAIEILNSPVDFSTQALGDTGVTPTTAPAVSNVGADAVDSVIVGYTSQPEANCTTGNDWNSNFGGSEGTDIFNMTADIESGAGSTGIPDNAGATANLLPLTSIASGSQQDILLTLDMPTTLGGGVTGSCSILLTVTASV